ncbi:hypothetical protein JOC77_003386 [Peribacillus deserti]|uniref:Permease n=1 Tax=Peribacillus deserti TaxID=673318 RepID=A0ABS2QLF6_9BACI|nr:CBO0543 family protein [Peribacillus deserti]MBM7693942.1 hypothetical protein [Peribacillus deserti]
MKNHIPAHEFIHEERTRWADILLEHWYHNVLFSSNWWLLLCCTLIPYLIWWKLADKGRLFEILSYGMLTAIISCFFDTIGVDLGLWDYPSNLFPLVPFFVPADFTAIPVTSMLLFQYFTSWKTFFAASVGLAVVFAYIFEPLFIKLQIFEMYDWKHIYGFIGFTFMFNINWFIMYFLKKRKFD